MAWGASAECSTKRYTPFCRSKHHLVGVQTQFVGKQIGMTCSDVMFMKKAETVPCEGGLGAHFPINYALT